MNVIKYLSGKRISFLLFFAFTFNTLFGQKDHIKFDHISLEQGLSQSTVFSIIQDAHGFMWFGTLDGLNKFDGFEMTVYRHDAKDSTSIPDNYINTLFLDSKNNLWIGTRNQGICIFNKTKLNFSSLRKQGNQRESINLNVTAITENKSGLLLIGTSQGISFYDLNLEKHVQEKRFEKTLQNQYISSLLIDEKEQIWCGTDSGLFMFNNDQQTLHFSISKEKPFQLPSNSVTALFEDSKGNIWIGTKAGLCKYSPPSQNIVWLTKKNDASSICSDNISSIAEDGNGDIWIGTKHGLAKYETQKEQFTNYLHNATEHFSLSENIIHCLFRDRSNALWIGTALGGINKCNRTDRRFMTYRHNPTDKYSLSNNKVRSVYKDKQGTYWVGTVEGGLNRWDRETDQFYHYQHDPMNPSSIGSNHVRNILEDRKGNLWVATDGGGLNLFDRQLGTFTQYKYNKYQPASISHDRVWRIFEDQQGILWIATFGGGLCQFNYTNKTFTSFRHHPDSIHSISNDLVTTVYEDQYGTLWIGTFGGGLNKFNPKTKRFSHYLNDEKDSTSLSDNRIYSIVEDDDGTLWIGTKGDLNRYNRATDDFTHFTEEDGLPNNVVMAILDDGNGNLWLSTNYGLSKFNKQVEVFRNYDIRDGLQDNEFLVGSFFKTEEGEMLIGGINGLNAFFPEDITDNPHIPDICITGFKIFNKEVAFDTAITEKQIIHLSWKDRVISFDYVALSFIFPQKNQFKYKMEGFDEDWNEAGNRRFATYTNLSGGEYKFIVKGSNNDDVWNEQGVAIDLIIKPPFWKTNWFYAFVAVFVFSLIYTYIKIRERKLKRDKKILEEKVRMRTAEIQKQKEEIEAQRDEIEAQRDQVVQQNELISAQKQEIMDSIHYAKRIQSAAIPRDESVSAILDDYFILYHPRDIVSGDFYWVGQHNKRKVVVAADCTGHGVPGAFMSMLGIAFINDIVNKEHITLPDKILDKMRSQVIISLKQKGEQGEQKDGMDASIITVDKEKKKVYYAGANNPLYLIRNDELIHIKGSRMPVAIHSIMEPYELHDFELKKGDVYYIFSDGYADQFGGPKGKKFMYKNLKELLLSIHKEPMLKQKQTLEARIKEWMIGHEQIDDILVIGVRV